MRVLFWSLNSVLVAAATLLLAGCDAQPQAGPVPLPVSQMATSSSPQPIPSGPAATTGSVAASDSPAGTPVAASSGFSLPIGADIPPASTNTASSSAGQATLNVPPLAQQPQPQAELPQPGNNPAVPPAVTPTAPQGSSIHLSAGVAVPQSLPIGTVMAISVDYAVRGRLNPSSHYVWVIKSGAGEAINEVALDNSGNLSAFFEKLKPEHRPFSARIEEVTPGSKRRTVISNEVPLQTSY